MSDELRNSSGEISRRNFLKDTGIILGGVTLASLGINSACSPTTTSTTTKASETTSPEMTASQQPVTIPTSEATTQSPSITTTAASTSATISATPTIPRLFVYPSKRFTAAYNSYRHRLCCCDGPGLFCRPCMGQNDIDGNRHSRTRNHHNSGRNTL